MTTPCNDSSPGAGAPPDPPESLDYAAALFVVPNHDDGKLQFMIATGGGESSPLAARMLWHTAGSWFDGTSRRLPGLSLSVSAWTTGHPEDRDRPFSGIDRTVWLPTSESKIPMTGTRRTDTFGTRPVGLETGARPTGWPL